MNKKFKSLAEHHDIFLKDVLNRFEAPALRLTQAINYALFPGGKRLRPLLVYLCGELIETDINCLDRIAAAVEITHCYSLIHDDLPAMDNDDYRRGKLSCHRAFDEATAILVGDGLQALAIDLLLTELPDYVSAKQVIAISKELVSASGNLGMVSGQYLDLFELNSPNLSESQLCQIHRLKTGKLISACINMVLLTKTVSNEIADGLRKFSHILGLVFQMQDDYLDAYFAERLGKKRASDRANNKTTFADLYNQAALLEKIQYYYTEAKNYLSCFEKADGLINLVNDLCRRTDALDLAG